ncbi:MAG: hypothetical protein AB8H12_21120 [Lewinella sp.]
MKSIFVTLFTLLIIIICFATVTASSGESPDATGHAGTDQHSWKPNHVWCYDYMGNFRMVTQCDESGGACSDQVCPCGGMVIEL